MSTHEGSVQLALSVIGALKPGSLPYGPLGSGNVPPEIMSLPIEIARMHLSEHVKKCRKHNCPHIPSALRRYQRMPKAIPRASEDIHSTLWGESDHEFVEEIRERVATAQPEPCQALADGSYLEEAELLDLIASGRQTITELATSIWATNFQGPSADELFRLCVGLTATQLDEDQPTEPLALEKGPKDLRPEIKELRTQLRESLRANESLRQTLSTRELERLKLQKELTSVQELTNSLKDELNQKNLEFAARARSETEIQQRLDEQSRVAANLRKERKRQQTFHEDLEAARADLARRLSTERRKTETLEMELARIPKGAHAVFDFLKKEEDRIQQDRTILSGGDRLQADQEWTAHKKLERAFLDAYPSFRAPRPARVATKSSLRLITLGGGSEIGRSSYLLELGERRILVDCGIRPGVDKDTPDLDRIDRIDGLVITHAHTDHVGWVPALVRKFGDFPIYCSEGTAALLPVVLRDTRQHYLRKQERLRAEAALIQNREPVLDEYEDEDVEEVSFRVISCDYDEPQDLPFGEISLEFFRAGHILGAASVLIQDSSGRRVLMSGDISSFPQLTVPPARWPEELGELDLLVLESTYGSQPHPKELDESHEEMVRFLASQIDNGGSTLVASFAIGRAQEILSLLHHAMEKGDLPKDTPVFFDGMIKTVNPIYERLANFSLREEFTSVVGEVERGEAIYIAKRKPSVVVTTSGMLAGGPVVEYASQLLPDPKHRLALTGYQDESAPTKSLLDMTDPSVEKRVVELVDESGEPLTFQSAHPAVQFSLSAHADQPGLLRYAGYTDPKVIALVHGFTKSQLVLKDELASEHPQSSIAVGAPVLEIP